MLISPDPNIAFVWKPTIFLYFHGLLLLSYGGGLYLCFALSLFLLLLFLSFFISFSIFTDQNRNDNRFSLFFVLSIFGCIVVHLNKLSVTFFSIWDLEVVLIVWRWWALYVFFFLFIHDIIIYVSFLKYCKIKYSFFSAFPELVCISLNVFFCLNLYFAG